MLARRLLVEFGICLAIAATAVVASCNPAVPRPLRITTKSTIYVSDAQAANLTSETLSKIKTGMTLAEVKGIVGPGMDVSDVKETDDYEVGWLHKESKKRIMVKFKGRLVVSTTSNNIP